MFFHLLFGYICGWVYGMIGWLFELLIARCVDSLFVLLFGLVFDCSFCLEVAWMNGRSAEDLMGCLVVWFVV